MGSVLSYFFGFLIVVCGLVLAGCAHRVVSPVDQNEYQSIRNVSYGDRVAQTLDIYVPNTKQSVMLPVHVYVHGGSWMRGDKKLSKSEIAAYTNAGMILVSLNYELGAGAYPQNLRDLEMASHWLKDNIAKHGGDASRMVLSGHSAGAHLVSLLAVGDEQSKRENVSIYRGIYAVDTASYNLLTPAGGRLAFLVNRTKRAVFGRSDTALKRGSPCHQIEPVDQTAYASLYLYVTQKRPDAVLQLRDFEARLKAAGQTVRTQTIGGGLSHEDMRKLIFTPDSVIFSDIMGQGKSQRRIA